MSESESEVMCNECQRRFEEMAAFADHLEESHGAISAFIRRRSTQLENGEPLP